MNSKLAEQIIKTVVNWNGQKVEFDRKYLEYNDLCELIVVETENTITLTTKFK
jgi:hypothetical protein